MKIILPQPAGRRLLPGPRPPRPRERGFVAVLVLLTLLALIVALVASNARVLSQLKQELRLIELKQLQRLSTRPPPAAAVLPSPTNHPAPPRNAPAQVPPAAESIPSSRLPQE